VLPTFGKWTLAVVSSIFGFFVGVVIEEREEAKKRRAERAEKKIRASRAAAFRAAATYKDLPSPDVAADSGIDR
jgi:hypothetical protein